MPIGCLCQRISFALSCAFIISFCMVRNSAISISRTGFGGISCSRIRFCRKSFALLTILRNRPGSQPFFSVFSRPGITFAEILRAGTETRPYKKQLRPMSGGPSCFYYEVKATICRAAARAAIRSARRPVSVPQIEASRFRPLKGKHISRYLREFGARRCVPTHGEYVQKES